MEFGYILTIDPSFLDRCKDASVHYEFRKQTGAASVVYHSELTVLVVLVS